MLTFHPDELLADFQQYYRISLWTVDLSDTSRDISIIAALAYQLPHDSRCWTALKPDGAHDWVVKLLRQIEYNQRIWHWAHTEGAKDESTAPEPMLLPGEEEAHERAVEHAEMDAVRTAALLGLTLGGHDG